MKEYLKNISSTLKNYSQSLDKKSILIEKPWTMIDDDMEQQKLIFKKNHELIISKNGKVQTGKWEYFSEAKSLLIDRGEDKLLCNEAYVDGSVLILRLDGTDNHYFALANSNNLPDLDIHGYFIKLRQEKEDLELIDLKSGDQLEISTFDRSFDIYSGAKVTIEAKEVMDGIYLDNKKSRAFYVANSQIKGVYHEDYIKNASNEMVLVHKQHTHKISIGDNVYLNDKSIREGFIDYDGDLALFIKNSKVVKIVKTKAPFFLSFFKKPKQFNYYMHLNEEKKP